MRTAAFVLMGGFLFAAPAAGWASQARRSAPRPAVTVLVTDMGGKPLQGVSVRASGPVEREAATDADGTVTLANLSAGSYRLRFEHDEYVTLEREVTVQTRALKTTAALSAAPPPPPPPKPDPVPTPVPSTPGAPPAQPTTIDIIDFIENNYVGSAPWLKSLVGCMPTATAYVLQLKEPLAEHGHSEGDEMIYVVAGNGVHRIAGRETPLAAGTFVVVPRGIPHSVQRRGSTPIMLLSIVSGAPCIPNK